MPRSAPRFVVEYHDGYATLTVHPSSEAVYAEDVLARLKLLGVPPVPPQLVERIVARATGRPERLVEWPAGEQLCALADVEVSEDRMTVWAAIRPPRKGGSTMSVEGFLSALEAAGVRHGVRQAIIRRMIEGQEFDARIVVARGTPPVHGRPRKVAYLFDTAVGIPYLAMEFDRINLRELNFIQNKHRGDPLAKLAASEPAQDGRDVLGEVVEARPAGEDEALLAGENVALTPAEDELVALADGNAFARAGVVHIEPVVEVDNVNYETGNLDFQGSIVVRNEIADGFTVRAGGSLEVGTCVGRAILSAGRRIVLRGGVNAGGEGSIECQGDIFARYIESANIRCKGNLLVEEALMHSRVSVHGALLLTGKRAEIVAGTAIVGGSVWCKRMGSVAEVRTRLTVGVDPDLVEEGMQVLHALQALRASTSPERDPETAARRSVEIEELERRWTELRKGIRADTRSMVVVEDRMYMGGVITFGREELRVPDRGMQRTILRVVDDRIVESGYNPAEPPQFPIDSGLK